MRINNRTHRLTAPLIATLTLACAAHATSPLEQIVNQQVNQQVDRYTQRGNERGPDNNSHNDRREDHDKRGRHGHHDRHSHGRDDNNHGGSSNKSCRDERGLRSIQGNVHTTMKFINRSNREIRTYWLDYNGRRVFYKAIPPNGNYTQPTYQTHPWVITDQRDNCIDIFVSNRPTDIAEIR